MDQTSEFKVSTLKLETILRNAFESWGYDNPTFVERWEKDGVREMFHPSLKGFIHFSGNDNDNFDAGVTFYRTDGYEITPAPNDSFQKGEDPFWVLNNLKNLHEAILTFGV